MASDRTTGLNSGEGAAGGERGAGRLVWLRWAGLAAWMGVIFRASATPDLKTVPLAQRFHLLPAVLGPQATDVLELLLRKSAHVISFGVLAWLAQYAFAGARPAWSHRRLAAAALCLTVLYAASDEWHQTFVPGREGRLRDVLIDTAGAVAALLLLWWRARRRSGQTSKAGG